MTREDDRAREEFTSEAEELLDTLSRDLVDFEAQGKNVRPEIVNKIFREIHSLKGLAGMLGFVDISELAHKHDALSIVNICEAMSLGILKPPGEAASEIAPVNSSKAFKWSASRR